MQVINWHTYNGFMSHIMHHERKKNMTKKAMNSKTNKNVKQE